ncbi:MAG: hypothetical protein GY716_25000 [bacterium]|nr:hypothetical protein [bacterium]
MPRATLIVGVSTLVLLGTGCPDPVHRSSGWAAMGDRAEAEIYTITERDADLALEEFREAIEKVEALVDPGDADGELARLNVEAGAGHYRVEDRDLFRMALLALDWARASRGAFDPTVAPLTALWRDSTGGAPDAAAIEAALGRVGWAEVAIAEEVRTVHFLAPGMSLDLGGVSKGFALDAAARAFTRTGNHGGVLRLGGNAYAWGWPPDELGHWVELADPRGTATDDWLGLLVANRGIASSGVRDAGAACPVVLDPATGRPAASDVLVAVAVADSAADADAVATALLVAGSHRGADLLTRSRRVEAVLLVRGDRGPELLASGSLEERLRFAPGLTAETEGRVRYLLPPAKL